MNKEETDLEIDHLQNITWHPHHEVILIDWADKANCYKWLHFKSQNKYMYKRNLFTIPVIIMSTLTGTANFALERIPNEYQSMFTIIIGSINILAGIITTISQFLKLNELAEGHRISALSWDKFYRNIKSELSKSPFERIHVTFFIKSSKDEFDRLMETSPNIDSDILLLFKKNLTSGKNKDEIIKKQKMFDELNKPEIFDEIPPIKDKVYTLNINEQLINEEENKINNILKLKKENEIKINQLTNFKKDFYNKFNREPTMSELITNNTNISKEEIIIFVN
jgi:hypothetical protein